MASHPRRWPRVLGVVGLSLFVLLIAVVALLQVPAVATWTARKLVGLAPLNPGYRLTLGRADGNWLTHLRLTGVRLVQDDRTLAYIEQLRVRYNPLHLLGSDVRLGSLEVTGARISARRENGEWDLAGAFGDGSDTTEGGGTFALGRLTVEDFQAEAMLAPDSVVRVRDLLVRARNLMTGSRMVGLIDTVDATVIPAGESPPPIRMAASGSMGQEVYTLDPLRIRSSRSTVSGRLVIPRNFDDPRLTSRLQVHLEAVPLALADLAAFYPAVRPEGELRLEANASAKGRLATATLAARLDQSWLRLEGGTLLGRESPALYQVDGEVRGLDPSLLLLTGPPGSLSGRIQADLQGATLGAADGAAVLRLSDSRIAGTEIDTLFLRAKVDSGRAQIGLDGDIAGTRISAEGWVRPFDSIPAYDLSGLARAVPGGEAVARTLAGAAGEPALNVRFRAEGAGVRPAEATVSGRVGLVAVRSDGEQVPLGHATISLADGRLRARPELEVAGGRVTAVVLATLGDTLTYELRDGVIAAVDLGRFLEDSVATPVSGRFAFQGKGASPEEAVASGRLRLEPIVYSGRRIEDLVARARISGGRARLEVRGALEGGTVALDAAARPFDSVMSFTVDRALLAQVDLGALLGRPDLSGPFTLQATARGRWGPETRSVRGEATVEPSRLGDIRITGGRLTGELRGQRVAYDAALTTSGGSLRLEGEAETGGEIPSFDIRRGIFDSLDLGVLLARPDLETALSGRFSGTATGATPDSMNGRLDLELLPSRVNQAELGPGRAEVAVAGGVVTGKLRLEGGDAGIAADLYGDIAGAQRRFGAEGTLNIEQLARWTGRADADGRLEGRFALEATADTAGLLSAGGTITAAGGVGGVHIRSIHAVLEPTAGSIVVDTLLVRSNVAVLDGSGRLSLRDTAGTDTLRLTGTTTNVGPLVELMGVDSLTLDSARVSVAVTGPPRQRRILADGLASRLLYASTLVEHLEVQGGATVDSAGVGGIAGDIRLRGAATGPVTIHQASFRGRYDSLVALEGSADLGGDVSLQLALQGEAAGDTTHAQLDRLNLTEGGRTWGLQRPAGIVIRPNGIAIDGFALRSGTRAIAIDGVVGLRDSSRMELRIDSLQLNALQEAGLVPVPGLVSGKVELSGPAETPVVDGRFALTVEQADAKNRGRIESALAWTRRSLRLDLSATSGSGGGRLTVNGILPWGLTLAPEDTASAFAVVREPGDTISLAIQADSFQIALFQPFLPAETATDLQGSLLVDARIRGTPEQPTAEGDLDLTGLGLRMPAQGIEYERGRMAGTMEGNTLRIDTLLLYTGKKNQLAARGEVRLDPLTNPALELTANMDRFQVINSSTLRAEASGEVRLAGTLEEPSLTGEVKVEEAEFFAGGTAGLAVEEVELTEEDRRELARHFGPAVLARAGPQDEILDRFRLDLDLRLPGRVWFRRRQAPEVNVEVAGRIRLRQEPGGEMQFFGSVEPVPGRSTLDVYGRTFSLSGGQILLDGPVEATRVEVTAEYLVPTQGSPDDDGVQITVAATGNPDSLDLEFSSEPEMEQEDMLSYIVTGRPSSDSPLISRGEGGEGRSQGEELALSQLTEAISSAAGEELGFDVFQIRQDATRGLTLTAGRYLSSRFFVSLQQPLELGGEGDQRPGTGLGPGFELQYRARPWLRVLLQGGSLPSGALFRGRYAY